MIDCLALGFGSISLLDTIVPLPAGTNFSGPFSPTKYSLFEVTGPPVSRGVKAVVSPGPPGVIAGTDLPAVVSAGTTLGASASPVLLRLVLS